jgi:hypothetical protein
MTRHSNSPAVIAGLEFVNIVNTREGLAVLVKGQSKTFLAKIRDLAEPYQTLSATFWSVLKGKPLTIHKVVGAKKNECAFSVVLPSEYLEALYKPSISPTRISISLSDRNPKIREVSLAECIPVAVSVDGDRDIVTPPSPSSGSTEKKSYVRPCKQFLGQIDIARQFLLTHDRMNFSSINDRMAEILNSDYSSEDKLSFLVAKVTSDYGNPAEDTECCSSGLFKFFSKSSSSAKPLTLTEKFLSILNTIDTFDEKAANKFTLLTQGFVKSNVTAACVVDRPSAGPLR